jgi:uncharacterized protein (UPF0548 family)
LHFGRLSPDTRQSLLRCVQQSGLTYQQVGVTSQGGPAPAGFHRHQAECTVGGPDVFAPAKQALTAWRAQRGAGAEVWPDVFGEGETVLVSVGLGPLRLVAPCRIVWIVDEPDRFGFAYGTLPGHPECGEEAFVVERGSDATTLRITAVSKGAAWYARTAGPLARLVQRTMTRRYGRSLQFPSLEASD